MRSFNATVRQFPPCGLTHASRVMPLERSRDAESAIVTQSLTPSKERALPVLPVAQVGPESEPLLPEPELSAAVLPEPASNEYAPTSPLTAAAAGAASRDAGGSKRGDEHGRKNVCTAGVPERVAAH